MTAPTYALSHSPSQSADPRTVVGVWSLQDACDRAEEYSRLSGGVVLVHDLEGYDGEEGCEWEMPVVDGYSDGRAMTAEEISEFAC